MPSINGAEYLVILVVALLVFGPQRLPEIASKVGGWIREIRTVANDFRTTLEAEVGDLKRPFDEATAPLEELATDTRRLTGEAGAMLEWNGPIHEQGPTPDDARADFETLGVEEGSEPDGTEEPEG